MAARNEVDGNRGVVKSKQVQRVKRCFARCGTDSNRSMTSCISTRKRTRRLWCIGKRGQRFLNGHTNKLDTAVKWKTEAVIRERYWWPRTYDDLMTLCKSCTTYGGFKNPITTRRAPKEPIKIDQQGQRAGIDIMGSLPMTRNTSRCIVNMVHYLTM